MGRIACDMYLLISQGTQSNVEVGAGEGRVQSTIVVSVSNHSTSRLPRRRHAQSHRHGSKPTFQTPLHIIDSHTLSAIFLCKHDAVPKLVCWFDDWLIG